MSHSISQLQQTSEVKLTQGCLEYSTTSKCFSTPEGSHHPLKKINQCLRTLSLTFAFQDREAKLIYKNAEVLKINNVITIQLQWIVGQKIML